VTHDPLDSAIVASHTLVDDPTHALSAVVRRTCTRCGCSVLSLRERTYGKATEMACEDAQAERRERSSRG